MDYSQPMALCVSYGSDVLPYHARRFLLCCCYLSSITFHNMAVIWYSYESWHVYVNVNGKCKVMQNYGGRV
ncbi:hypothetical protein T05_14661 [Trichinella murrelli]|uniref:Uncharacterized protein n=1 Tax=Trichinella murrelli TaxID=144512 RepID=A0A0V0T8I5_9BILA|nr:hypothetical protein T05_14661 [Trichinella murrelli]